MSGPTRNQLVQATGFSFAIAAIVLVVAVMPAEYGLDPTGLGEIFGFTRLRDDGPPLDAATSDARNETYAFTARFALVEEEVGNWSGRMTLRDRQHDIAVPLNVSNLTRLTARLEWSDDAPGSGPDTFEVSIRGHGRTSDLATSDSGAVNATLQWRSIPYPTSTADGGLRIENATDTSSHGEWRLVLRLYGTGASPEAPDDGNAWTLRLFAERYEVTTTSLEGAADRVTLTLPPRGQVEYKFEMAENASMTYAWSATAPVHSDLHGDRAGNEDDFTSARVDTLTGDAGVYVAPFDGRHGWYWRNDADAPVTITLETRGAYRILGVSR